MRHLLFVIFLYGLAVSAVAAIDRQYDPVVISGEHLSPLFGAPIGELVVQRYNASGDTWQSVPFQIDERDVNGNYFGIFDGVLSANDELLVMARDLGDRAINDAWPDDVQAQGRFRVELTVIDAGSGQMGYAYLFWSSTLDKNNVAYLNYMINDVVKSESYIVAHDPDQASGLPTALIPKTVDSVPDSSDVLDHQRLRLKLNVKYAGQTLNILPDIEENMHRTISLGILGSIDLKVVQKQEPNVIVGPIRVVRRNTFLIGISGNVAGTEIPYKEQNFSIKMFYLPNYYEFSGENEKIPSIPASNDIEAKVTEARFSNGMSTKAYGMIYYNSLHGSEGFRINEIEAGPELFGLSDKWPGKHWTALVGAEEGWKDGNTGRSRAFNAPFTMFSLIILKNYPLGTSQSLYFYENTNEDDQDDHIISKIYAINGLKINSTTSSISGELDLAMRHYVLPENLTFEQLSAFFETYKNEFVITPLASTLDVVQPDQVLDLAVEQTNENSMTLSWTAVGDDGSANGPASSYQMRYSTQPLTEENRLQWWAAATPVQNLPAPADPGTLQNVTITGLDIEQQYFFVLQVGDDVGNLSELSQVASGSTTPVELQSFTLSADKDQVFIDFSTASESQNWGFELQRRVAAEQDWQTIAFLKGHGTTSETQSYTYTDEPNQFGTLEYRLKQIDLDGQTRVFDAATITLNAPREFVLAQNYPNPFNPTTQIAFEIPENVSGEMSLIVYDMLGRRVRTLVEQPAQAGFYQIEWNGRDDNNRLVSSGIYFYVLRTQNETLTRKMIKLH